MPGYNASLLAANDRLGERIKELEQQLAEARAANERQQRLIETTRDSYEQACVKNESLASQLAEARAECERLRKRVAYNPWSHHITCAVWNGSAACTCKHPFTNEAAAAGGE